MDPEEYIKIRKSDFGLVQRNIKSRLKSDEC